ncbi:DNA-binding transcriptional regulator, GntR family [Ruania alba]|uniref:DNA-binding transcriptional regulator, GntR family n=1 Tax=Ruania alba TaxID=648782 RepID=A0A1H5M6C7_9MICO|nr:DNA-binding transcriptional regulator, GntR family [Ruania alba]
MDRRLPARRALVDDVYDAVLALLMDQVIGPGERASIDGLARELDVSPTPVREALTRLEVEGLVVKRALKGYVAAPLLDAAGMRDLYEMRRLLEPEAARRTAERAATGVGEQLATLLDAMRSDGVRAARGADRYGDYRQFIDEDMHFHHVVANASGSPLLEESIVRLRAHMHLYRLNFRHTFVHDTNDEHAAILSAVRGRDPEAARVAMLEHIDSSYARISAAASLDADHQERTP